MFCVVVALFLPAFAALAQEGEQASATPAKKTGGVKLQFLPPPMEGTFSLGIYDGKGKLVRTLHREAELDDFTAALDGLITHWDGRDDAGAQMPAGKYFARGYCVGDEVKIKRATASGSEVPASETPPQNASPSPNPMEAAASNEQPTPAGSPVAPAIEVLSSPSPSASPTETEPKTTETNATLEAAKDKLKTPEGKPFVPEEKVKLKLVANPLNQEKPGAAEVTAGLDDKGSFLKLTDGLPLKRVSETPHLKWVAIARGAEPGSVVLFQSDGTVIEQFTILKLVNMMAFDCGDFDYEPTQEK